MTDSHDEPTTSQQPTASETHELPGGLAAPARRALAGYGISSLEDLATRTGAEVLALHGMGPNAMAKLRDALAAKGLTFSDRS